MENPEDFYREQAHPLPQAEDEARHEAWEMIQDWRERMEVSEEYAEDLYKEWLHNRVIKQAEE